MTAESTLVAEKGEFFLHTRPNIITKGGRYNIWPLGESTQLLRIDNKELHAEGKISGNGEKSPSPDSSVRRNLRHRQSGKKTLLFGITTDSGRLSWSPSNHFMDGRPPPDPHSRGPGLGVGVDDDGGVGVGATVPQRCRAPLQPGNNAASPAPRGNGRDEHEVEHSINLVVPRISVLAGKRGVERWKEARAPRPSGTPTMCAPLREHRIDTIIARKDGRWVALSD